MANPASALRKAQKASKSFAAALSVHATAADILAMESRSCKTHARAEDATNTDAFPAGGATTWTSPPEKHTETTTGTSAASAATAL